MQLVHITLRPCLGQTEKSSQSWHGTRAVFVSDLDMADERSSRRLSPKRLNLTSFAHAHTFRDQPACTHRPSLPRAHCQTLYVSGQCSSFIRAEWLAPKGQVAASGCTS